jgi:hypothetical protein
VADVCDRLSTTAPPVLVRSVPNARLRTAENVVRALHESDLGDPGFTGAYLDELLDAAPPGVAAEAFLDVDPLCFNVAYTSEITTLRRVGRGLSTTLISGGRES